MNVDGYYEMKGEFQAVSHEEANIFNGYPDETCENVRVIENGDVVLKIQAIMKYSCSYAVVTYIIPKAYGYIDVNIKMLANDVNTAFKLRFDTEFENSSFIGQQMFGREEMHKEEKEAVFQKWCGLFEEGKGLAVLNRGTCGGSAMDNILNITLMRTPVYLAHPIEDRPITETNRSHEHIDMGERDFDFRITADTAHLDCAAEEYNMPPFAVSFFPSGYGERKETEIRIDNRDIIMTRCVRSEDGRLLIRMYNTLNQAVQTDIIAADKRSHIEFAPFEIKTCYI